MLRLVNLTKSFGGVKAVDNVSVDFKPGRITSLIGPNGAGKTTLFNLISGFLKPDKGEILLEVEMWKMENRSERQEDRSKKQEARSKRREDRSEMLEVRGKELEAGSKGLEVRSKKMENRKWKIEARSTKQEDRSIEQIKIHQMKPFEIAQLGIGRLFQDVRVFKKLRSIDNVILGAEKLAGENPLEAVFLNHKVRKYERGIIEKAKEVLDFVELKDKTESYGEDLSYGQQKLLALARLLFGNYDVLLLDEPTAGVNPAMIDKILSIIKDMAKRMNKMVIVIEHNMNVVYKISDWVYFMNEGAITAFGLPDDVLGNEEVKRLYIGL